MFKTREDIYNELVGLLTEYEHPEDVENWEDREWETELYEMLVNIQNRWKDTITTRG